MRTRQAMSCGLALLAVMVLTPAGCYDNDDGPVGPVGEHTGQPCAVAEDCYPWLEGGTLLGERTCLDRVSGGYCTHTCQQDSDCCGTPGECKTAHPQVCAPFESTGIKMCFLSCEEDDVRDANVIADDRTWDSTWYCQTYAWTGFGCRSTGGGAENRKVCVP
jgi:hypothetical protein